MDVLQNLPLLMTGSHILKDFERRSFIHAVIHMATDRRLPSGFDYERSLVEAAF
jgi:hypothetical protein